MTSQMDVEGRGRGKGREEGGKGSSSDKGGGKQATGGKGPHVPSDSDQKRRRVALNQGGQKHEFKAQAMCLGFSSADWNKVRLRVHKTCGRTMRMLVFLIPA